MSHNDTTEEIQQRDLRRIMEQFDIVIVHTGETSVLQWNPDTHEEAHEELPDGNMRTIIRPKGESE